MNLQAFSDAEDGGDMFYQNVGISLKYTVLQHRRRSSPFLFAANLMYINHMPTHFDREDSGSRYSRNVGNFAHIHTSRLNINSEPLWK
jgi:hypothetical protein